MSCYASTLVQDGTTSSSAIGRLFQNSLDTHVVTGTGHLVKIYKLARDDLLEELTTIPLTSVVLDLKIVQIPGQTFDEIVTLNSDGSVFRVSVGTGQCFVTKIFMLDTGVVPDKKTFGVVREEGVVMIASSQTDITVIDLSSGFLRKLHTKSTKLSEIVPLPNLHFAVLESELPDSCVLKVHKYNKSQEFAEDTMETSSMELKEMGENPSYISDGECPVIFEHNFPGAYGNMLPIHKPFRGLILFTDDKMACIPLPVDTNADQIDQCRDSIRCIQHPFGRLTAVHLNENGKIMVGTESGSIHLFSIVTDTNSPMVVSNISESFIKHGDVTCTFSSIRNLFFAGSKSGNSCWLSMENTPDNNITSTRKQVFESFGPVKDLVVMSGLDRLKVIALCGEGQDSSIRVLQNCVMFKSVYSIRAQMLEVVQPLKIGSVNDSWILVSSKERTELYRVSDEIVEKKDQNLFLRGNTIMAADVGPFVVQITPTAIHIVHVLTGPTIEGYMPLKWFSNDIQVDLSNSITVIDVVGRRIVIAEGKTINVYEIVSAPDSGSVQLLLRSSRTFTVNVSCMTIHTSIPDASQPNSSKTALDTVHLVAGFSNSYYLLVINLDSMVTTHEIPLPGKLAWPKDVIAIGSDIVFSGGSGLYHVENFCPTTQTPPIVYAPRRVPATSTEHYFCAVSTESPGIFAISKNTERGVCLERWASRTTFPGVQGAILLAGFRGRHFERHVIVYDGNSLSMSRIYRRAVRIPLGDHATKMANNATVTFGVITHRIDYEDVARNSRKSLTRQMRPESVTVCGRKAYRNAKWDADYEKKDAKEVCSILFFDVDTMVPRFTVQLSPYETARYIVSGQIDGSMNHYYVVSTCLSYPQKEHQARSSLYILKVTRMSLELIAQYDFPSSGEPSSLQISNRCLYASFGDREYICELANGQLRCRSNLTLSAFTIGSAPGLRAPAPQQQAVRSSTLEDIRKGDYSCPSLALAMGTNPLMKASAPLTESLVVAIGFGRDIRRMFYYQNLQHGGSYYIPSVPTAIKTINLLSNDQMGRLFVDKQVVFGTETGSIGFVLLLTEQWSSILERVEYSINQSPDFRGTYSNYFSLFQQRSTYNHGFCDGDKIELLLKMTDPEIKRILQSVPFNREDKQLCGVSNFDSLLAKLQLFSSALNICYTGLTHE